MQYIASRIEHIDVNFKYNFEMNKNIKYDYYYYVDAVTTISQKSNNKILASKTIRLLDDKLFTNRKDSGFSIDEKIIVNYSDYNELVKSYKSKNNISADSNLKLSLHVYVDGIYEDFKEPVRTNNKMDLVIPLSEQTLDIEMNYKEINNSDVVKLVNNDGTINQKL